MGSATKASLELNLDVNNTLATQGRSLEQITTHLDSVKAYSLESFHRQYLRPYRIDVTFATSTTQK